jgi:hypothetical protein
MEIIYSDYRIDGVAIGITFTKEELNVLNKTECLNTIAWITTAIASAIETEARIADGTLHDHFFKEFWNKRYGLIKPSSEPEKPEYFG